MEVRIKKVNGVSGMIFKPYKGRTMRFGEQVEVYRNLNINDGYSIRSAITKKVLAHCSRVTLSNCVFVISESGRQLTIRKHQKQVHAVVRGTILGVNGEKPSELDMAVTYNPYQQDSFFQLDTLNPVLTASIVHCEGKNCYVSSSEQEELALLNGAAYSEEYSLFDQVMQA